MSEGARIVSAEFGQAGTLTIHYQDRAEPETVRITPVPRPRTTTIELRWAADTGVIIDGADPEGQRFVFSDRAVGLRLIDSLRDHGPVSVRVVDAPRPTDEERGTVNRMTVDRGAEPPSTVDLSVLTDARPAAFLIAAGQRWAPAAPLPVAPPLTRAQIDSFVASSPAARHVAETVARTWREYAAAGGADSAQYAILAETLLVQWERKNPSAAPGFLRVAAKPFGWGSTGAATAGTTRTACP